MAISCSADWAFSRICSLSCYRSLYLCIAYCLAVSLMAMSLRLHVLNYPSPSNLSYAWNLGFLSLCSLGLQVLSGIFLAMHYVPSTDYAFTAVEHLLRDVNYGWLLRYLHANGASLFFAVVYLHMYRGLFYSSYARPRHIV